MNQPPADLPPVGGLRSDSLGRAYSEFGDHLRKVAGRGLGPDLAAKVGASDIVQDTFFAANRDLDAYQGRTPREFRNWLEGILQNRLKFVRRHFRKVGKRRVALEMPIGHPGTPFAEFGGEMPAATTCSPLSRVVHDERADALRAALDELGDPDRQIILCRQRDRLSFPDLGARLGISEDAARKRWARALVRLRDLMGPNDDSR